MAEVDLRQAQPDSPEWWLIRLLRSLDLRAGQMNKWDDYYNGVQPLAFASEKFRDAFGDRFPAFSSNFMALVVDGEAERLEVAGFKFKDQIADRDIWELWQRNNMDGQSQLAHTEALVKGLAYALVEPGADGPLITVEDPLDCIVEHAPRKRTQRLMGMKRWIDPDGHLVVFVYSPDAIYKYRSVRGWPERISGWPAPSMMANSLMELGSFEQLDTPDEDWPLSNPLGAVPLVALPNRPRVKVEGRSEIAPVMSNQDAVNKYRADALIAAEYVAYPQRWALNLEVKTDPDTGRPIEPFKAGHHLWTVPPPDTEDGDVPQVEFGQFPAADLGPYQEAIQTEVGAISSISRMPYHYFLGQPQSVPPSGESLKSSEAGLIKKVGRAAIYLGEGWEETMRLALKAMNDERATQTDAMTIWADPETRNEATMADSTIKLFQAKVIDHETALRRLNFTPTEIERILAVSQANADAAAAAATAAAAAANAPVNIQYDPVTGRPVSIQ
jgi:hypothetical protein